jgi:3',5'-cyclic-AMP phosphodiesterase
LHDRARPYTVVQLTDLHLFSAPDARLLGVDTALTFEAAVDAAFRGGAVDAVVVTGDIAHRGEPEAYRRAQSLLSRYHRGPTMWLPGNHDIEASMQMELPTDDAIVLGNWLLLALDTHVDGEEGGYVGSEELERAAGALRRSNAEHVVAFGHHPCVPVGTPWLDPGRIEDARELLEALDRDGRVRAYAFGHIHHGNAYPGAAWPILSSPATCFEFAQGGARFGVEARTPGSRRFTLAPDGALESTVVRAAAPLVTPDLKQFR